MSEVKWIKIYIDMFDKRKIKKIRRLPAGNDILLIWIMLLSMAGKCNAGGMIYITESVPFTEEDLADELGFEVGTIRLAMTAFTELDMISTDDTGFININGWEEYQNVEGMEKIRESKRLAQARWRAKQKELPPPVDSTVDSTRYLVDDAEEEKEEDKEKEIHSIIHSVPDEEENVENFSDDCESRRRYLGGIGKGVVFLSDEQMSDLLDKLSIEEFDRYVGIVAECELKGRHYKKKTHYQAILDMVAKDRKVR